MTEPQVVISFIKTIFLRNYKEKHFIDVVALQQFANK